MSTPPGNGGVPTGGMFPLVSSPGCLASLVLTRRRPVSPQLVAPDFSTATAAPATSAPPSSDSYYHLEALADAAVGAAAGAATDCAAACSASGARVPPISVPGFCLDDDEAENLLCLFMQHMSFFTPFLQLPPETTAAALRAEKPMLFFAIMFASSYHDLERQKDMNRTILAYISHQIFRRGHKNLQMLQGLLVFIHWSADVSLL